MQITNWGSSIYVKLDNYNILFGSFSEIHKNIIKAQLPFPEIVIISDVISQEGISQLVPEFLFFGHLFIEKNFDENNNIINPLIFIGDSRQCKRVKDILEVSYLGLSSELLKSKIDIDKPIYKELIKESDYFAIKDEHGKILPIETYVKFLNWNNNIVSIDKDLLIEKIGPTKFKLHYKGTIQDINLDLSIKPKPIWKLPDIFSLKNTHQFALYILGAAEPWYPDAPSTSYLLCLHGFYYLIDCAPFTHTILEKFGIGVEQIKGIIVTHIHDDHSGDLLIFAQSSIKTQIITTIEIWESIKIKLAAIMDKSEEEINNYFEFRQVTVGQTFYLAGATIDFHYACHSVPTIGLTINSCDESITITSDTASKKLLDDMLQKSVISQDRYDKLASLLTKGKVIADCGENMIHGSLDEVIRLDNTNQILCTHRHDLPQEYEGILKLAQPFQFFLLGTQDQHILDTVIICQVLQHLEIQDFWSWGSIFSLHKHILEYPKDTIILKQGDTDKNYFYIITYGFLDVIIDNKVVAKLQGSNFFGEQIFLSKDKVRTATIKTTSPVRLIGIPGNYFEAMLNEEDQKLRLKKLETLREKFIKLWRNREVISKVKIFADLDVSVKNKLSLHFERINLEPNVTLILPNKKNTEDIYFVEKGTLEATFKDKFYVTLKENDIFGKNYGFIKVKDAVIKTLEKCNLLKITNKDLELLSIDSPQIVDILNKLSN